MVKNLRLDSPFLQYIIGLFLNLLVIAILLSSNVTYNNIQIPEGKFKNNLWKGTDTYSYVKMARNYLQYGVVGEGKIPASNRTIGYPIYLALMMKFWGNNWLMVLFFIQAALFASIYPVFTKIIQLLFGNNKKLIKWTFLFLLISGAYFSSVTFILTDAIFTVLFTIGIYFSIITIVKNNWLYFLLHIIFIGLAGQIRPILFLYAIPNFFVLFAIARKHNVLKDRKVRTIIVSSSILVLFVCNMPTLRNYINYGVITPATVLQNNLFGTHAIKILFEEKQDSTINELYSKIDTTKKLDKELDTKVKSAIEIYREYPLAALKLFTVNIAKIMVKNHYTVFSNFWGYNWNEKNRQKQTSLKKSNLIFYVTIISAIIYAFICLLLASFLIRLIKMKKFYYFLTVLIFLSYFIIPSGFVSEDLRFKLPVEGFIVIFSIYEFLQLTEKNFWFRKAKPNSIQN